MPSTSWVPYPIGNKKINQARGQFHNRYASLSVSPGSQFGDINRPFVIEDDLDAIQALFEVCKFDHV